VPSVGKLAGLLNEHRADLGRFMNETNEAGSCPATWTGWQITWPRSNRDWLIRSSR